MPSLAQWDPLVLAAATRYALPVALVKAIMACESGGDPGAYNPERNNDPSRGLMQVRESTARGLGYRGPAGPTYRGGAGGLFDPLVNVDLGAKYLRQMWERFAGDFRAVIASYNGGPGIVARKDAQGRYPNQRYVDCVVAKMVEFGAAPLVVGPAIGLAFLLLLWWYWRRWRG